MRSEFCSIEHTFPICFEFVAKLGRRGGSGLAARVEHSVKRRRGLRGRMLTLVPVRPFRC